MIIFNADSYSKPLQYVDIQLKRRGTKRITREMFLHVVIFVSYVTFIVSKNHILCWCNTYWLVINVRNKHDQDDA